MAILLAEAYLHGLDPFLIKFPASWWFPGLRWYGLAYLAGFLVAWFMVRWMARSHRTAIPVPVVPDLMIYLLIGVLVGGRLGYCFFYEPKLLNFTSAFPFWGVLAIYKGGMASHGGILGVITVLWIFATKNHLSKLHLLDVAAFTTAPGLFFGRLANFVNFELWGRALPQSMQQLPPWWSVKYPQEIESWSADKLARLIYALQDAGFSVPQWQDARTTNRIIEAVQAGDPTVIAVIRPELTAYYPSQLFQAITDGPMLMLLLVLVWLKPRKPGVVGSWFLGGYGAMRFATEYFREPDQGVALLVTPLGNLSRGQVLSLLMVVVSLVAVFIVARREVEPIGGLLPAGADQGS